MFKDITFGRMFVKVILAGSFSGVAMGQLIVDDTFDVGAATPDDDPDDPFDVFCSSGFVVDDGGLLMGNALEAGVLVQRSLPCRFRGKRQATDS